MERMRAPLLLVCTVALAAAAGCYGFGGETVEGTAPAAAPSSTADAGSGSAGIDVFGGPSTCTSGKTVPVMTGDGTSDMNPGQACIACHSAGEGPTLFVAGTVYPTGHEPDQCNGTGGADIKVIITDATGKEFSLTPSPRSGNFYLGSSRRNPITFTMPYSARVERGGKVVEAMGAHQSDGDCNSCHTDTGANGAPGRIAAPAP